MRHELRSWRGEAREVCMFSYKFWRGQAFGTISLLGLRLVGERRGDERR